MLNARPARNWNASQPSTLIGVLNRRAFFGQFEAKVQRSMRS
jgi:hypothetical protein